MFVFNLGVFVDMKPEPRYLTEFNANLPDVIQERTHPGRAGPSPSGALGEVDRGGPPTQVNSPIDMGVKL